MLNQFREILTVEELCEVLLIGRNRAYELLKTGQLRGFQIGRTWKIPRIALEEYLMRQTGIK